jgi:hypothetical protein
MKNKLIFELDIISDDCNSKPGKLTIENVNCLNDFNDEKNKNIILKLKDPDRKIVIDKYDLNYVRNIIMDN